MSHNLQRLNYEDNIRFLILRYPHNATKVAEEATKILNAEITVEEVLRIQARFKRTMDRDVGLRVAANLAQHVIQGSMERCAKLEAMFQLWDGKDVAMESLCCQAPVIEHPGLDGASDYYVCAKCGTTCGTRTTRDEALQKLKIKLLQEMRAESEHLITFAKQMGFTVPQEPAPIVNNKNNFLIVGQQQNTQVNGPAQIDGRMAQKVESMSPVERERLIHDLQKMAEQVTIVGDVSSGYSDPGQVSGPSESPGPA